MADIGHLTDTTVEVWRNVRTADGAGGWLTTRLYSHDLEVRISTASISDRKIAALQSGETQGAAVLSHVIYADGLADCVRGDELRDEEFDTRYRVIGIQRTSRPDTYVRADCQMFEFEPEDGGGS